MQIKIDWNRMRTDLPWLLPVLLIAGYLLALTTALAPANIHAQTQNSIEPESNEENIELHSDLASSKIEDEVRITTFTTNVEVTQGAMEILGDVAIFLQSMTNNEQEKVTVYGHPAHFKHVSAETGELTEGHSDSIVFDNANQDNVRIITLTGNVRITRQASELSGDNAELLENTSSGEIEKATVYGKPARYQQLAESTGEATQGLSDVIFYKLVNETVIEFVGNAEFTQPDLFFSCATVTHYPDDESTTTTGPCSGIFPASN